MKWSRWLQWSGAFGLAFVVLEIAGVVTFLVGGQPPGIADSAKFADYIGKNQTTLLTGAWLTALAGPCFLIWIAGVRSVLRKAGEDWEWAAALFFGTSIAAVATATVAGGIFAAAVVDTTTRTEPAAVKGLFEAGGLILGTVIWFLTALAAAVAAFVTTRTRVLPRWTAWVGYAAAVLNLITTGSIYGGGDPSGFYTATGFAGIVLGLLPFLIWITCLGVVMLRMTVPAGAPARATAAASR